MGKRHYGVCCGVGRTSFGKPNDSITDDPSKVTCCQCRKLVDRYGLRPRWEFPEVPTFEVFAIVERIGDRDVCYLVFRCPCCGGINRHGGVLGQPGAADGHRGSHCYCWEKGYFIREVPEDQVESSHPLASSPRLNC